VDAAWTPKVQGIKDVIDYMEAEDFMTVAARPGEGKSSYMRYEFYNAAKRGASVGILNYENSPIEYLRYFLGIETGIDTHKLKNPRLLTQQDKEDVRTGIERLSHLKIRIDTTQRTASSMIRSARRMAAKDNITLLGVDYIQLINNGSDNRATDIGLTTGTLRQFALDYHIPVIANAQLSRDIERRSRDDNGNVEPELSDLRESGAIEQDSTIVMFPRPQRNPSAQVLALFPENREGGIGRLLDRPRAIPTTFYIKKNRNGNTGPTEPILWLKHTGEYRTLERGVLGR
jgi:replicative DNA helicase